MSALNGNAATPLNAAANGAKNNGAKNNGAKNNANKTAVNNAAAAELGRMANAVVEPSANGSNAASKPANEATGGRRRTKKAKKSLKGGKRRISKGASKWNQFVMRTFKEMRKKNKTVKLMDAMKECAKQKKKGVKY